MKLTVSPARIGFLLLILTVMVSGIASAKVMPQQPPEVQILQIQTSVLSSGIFKHKSDLMWALSSEYLDVNAILVEPDGIEIQPEPPLNPAGEVQMYCTYTEDTSAINGAISFDKVGTVDTRAKAGRDWNVENERMITFTGYDAGSVLSTEDLNLDAVGTSIDLAFSTLCPFAPDEEGCNCIPMFCNQIGAGSAIDLDTFSLVSSANLRNVNRPGDPGFIPPIPTSDEPARFFFQIEVTGQAPNVPASGMISTYLDEQGGEGGTEFPGLPDLYQTIDVHEYREIIGETSLFAYKVDYESGIMVT
jgi:hypothetical protein